jgi:hypothetical protein
MVNTGKVQEYYIIKCKCNNCGYEGEAQVKKGEEVPKDILCPNCECYTAHKSIPIKIDYNKEYDKLRYWNPRNDWPWIHLEPITIQPSTFPKPLEVWCTI